MDRKSYDAIELTGVFAQDFRLPDSNLYQEPYFEAEDHLQQALNFTQALDQQALGAPGGGSSSSSGGGPFLSIKPHKHEYVYSSSSLEPTKLCLQPAMDLRGVSGHEPDQTLPTSAAPGSYERPNSEFAVSQCAEKSINKKSQQARNAANQRHSRSKRKKKDGPPGNDGVVDVDTKTAEGWAQKLREKNKLAATRCRYKKKKQIESIEAQCNHLSVVNAELKKQFHELRDELARLRMHALDHQGCNCGVAWYNVHQAKKLATGSSP